MRYSARLGLFAAALPVALMVTAVWCGQARAEDIRLEALRIPVAISGSNGTVGLEAIVLRPDDQLPHPLAVLNHGSPRNAEDRSTMSPYGMWAQAAAFARRGWVAVVFMRRGYGRSEGARAEGFGSCADPDYARAGRAGARDIAAVAQFMTSQPHVSNLSDRSCQNATKVKTRSVAKIARSDPPTGMYIYLS